MPRKRTNSKNHYGLWNVVKMPILQIKLKPKFVEGAKTKIYDEKGNVVYDAEKQMTISGPFVLEDRLTDALMFLHDNGMHEADINPLIAELPLRCPICDKEGNPVFQLDKRNRNKKWIERNTPIHIYYYHGSRKHYYGIWKNGAIHLSPKITDIRKATARGHLFSNKL